MLLIVKGVATLAGQGQILFQVQGRDQRSVCIGVQPLTVQQTGNLILLQLGQEGFSRPGGMHRQLAADRGRHAHQLRTLHLVNNDGLMIVLVKHGQVHRLAGILHQLAQDGMHNRQQVAAL